MNLLCSNLDIRRYVIEFEMCVSCRVCSKFSIVMQWFINLFVTVNMWMDRVILLYISEPVSEQYELVGMRRQVITF
jgi:hypothetical protein